MKIRADMKTAALLKLEKVRGLFQSVYLRLKVI